MSDVAKTPREELECKKKYLYEYSMFWECNDGSKCQILEDDVCDLLNEQQSIIQSLQDLCGKSDYENAKLRLKNKELQGKIDVLCEERDYWKSKEMTLLMQVRRLTSRMTDKEVKEFSKELEE